MTSPNHRDGPTSSHRMRRVLLVAGRERDGAVKLADVVRDALGEIDDVTLSVNHTAEAALVSLSASRPAVIIVGMTLDGPMTPLQAVREFSKHYRHTGERPASVLLLVALSTRETETVGIGAGASMVIEAGPLRRLVASVRWLLGEREGLKRAGGGSG